MSEVRIDFIECEKLDLKNYTLVEGFPGMGLAGTIAAKFLVDNLKLKEVCFIDSNIFVPVVRIHAGIPVFPARFYINKKKKLILLISEQIVVKEHTNELAQNLVNWIKKKKISKVISLAGINAPNEKQGSVFGISANDKSLKILEKFKVKIIKEGITTGITALMLLKLKEENINAISLLGNVTIGADYKASAAVVKKLDEILDLKINVSPLLKEAKNAEVAILKHLKNVKRSGQEIKNFEHKSSFVT